MFPTHDMNPRAINAMIEDRNRRLERALETAGPLALPDAGPLVCIALFLAAVAVV